MKVLFFMRSTLYVRNFESTLRLLAERGHQVHVAAELHPIFDPTDVMSRLSREYAGITHSAPPTPDVQRRAQFDVELRKGIDYLRYFGPEYRDAAKLRWRADLNVPAYGAWAAWKRLVGTPRGRKVLEWLLRRGDRALPINPVALGFIRDLRPDLVLVTPLVEPGSPQAPYLRSARALGIPTGLCVYSWDNLTNKGLIHDPLDLVTVWNEAMKEEAVTFHRVPADRVVVTGAAAYDHWFTWRPRESREDFCSRVGLDPQRPYLLYLCSSRFIAPNEGPFVRQWIHSIRAASPALQQAGVLVRPHPQNVERWHDSDFSDLQNVAVWPRGGANPVEDDSRAEYYDSIFHSAAVVGINTSALIESAIVGRGVFTLLAPEYRDTQDGTLHFRHLREVNGGLLNVASDVAEHVAQLEAALQDPRAAAERCRRFVEAFVRPYGIDEAAAPRLVAALEDTAARGAAGRDAGPWWGILVRPVLRVAASAVRRTKHARALADAKIKVEKRHVQQERAARRKTAAAEAAFVAKSASEAFGHYLHVREQARRMHAAAATADGPTPSERRVLAALDPLWDAAPETIAVLRRQTAALSGVSAADYEDATRSRRFHCNRDLRRLLAQGDAALWVNEPPVLGAFGFSMDGKRFNEDTLRWFRVISLLHDAALLDEFRDDSSRRTVWEIGGGWGGFACHFKTLCPNTTYLITGRPELFLLSGVYLRTLFPNARFRFYDPADPDAFWHEWGSVDFAFAPESVVADMQPASLDLTIDVMALERMTRARVCLHVKRAYDLGSRYIASVCAPDGSDDAVPVRPALDGRYWPHPVCAPESLARRLSLSAAQERTYFLGWRRLLV